MTLDRVISEVPMPGQWLAVILNLSPKAIRTKLAAQPAALVFKRGRTRPTQRA